MPFAAGQSIMSNPFQRELEGHTVSSTDSREESLSKNEDIIWRKVDIHLVPWLAVLYFFSFLQVAYPPTSGLALTSVIQI